MGRILVLFVHRQDETTKYCVGGGGGLSRFYAEEAAANEKEAPLIFWTAALC